MSTIDRRKFLKKTLAVAGGTVAASCRAPSLGTDKAAKSAVPVPEIMPRRPFGANETIQIALVGCGGRGTGAAAQALSTAGPTKLVAMADVLPDSLQRSCKNLKKKFPKDADVPEDHRFLGFDAYKKAIDLVSPGGVVLLTTPPAFRPMHLEYAVEKGVNVFMEKSFAVDGPGIRRVLAAGKKASAKGLKIAGGLMSRHGRPTEQVIQRIHDGMIGDVLTLWAYRMHQPVYYKRRRPGENELTHQIRNYSCFTWLNGSFFLDWMIHGLDICCWAKNAWPIGCSGLGGRQARKNEDQLFDHYAVEFRWEDGTRMMAQGRHMLKTWNHYVCTIHGTKGTAVTGEGNHKPRIYKGWKESKENLVWQYKGPRQRGYQKEHDLLFDAVRNNTPYNEAERSAHAALVGILGRMATMSGQYVTWDQALNSDVVLAPGLERMTMDSEPPVKPDANGTYPVAIPGVTRTF